MWTCVCVYRWSIHTDICIDTKIHGTWKDNLVSQRENEAAIWSVSENRNQSSVPEHFEKLQEDTIKGTAFLLAVDLQ